MTKKISIVIVSYNVCDFVISGIASLYKYCKLPLEIIVIDNNSSDNTIDKVRNTFKDVIAIENKINIGFSAANNQAFKLCTGDYVLMFNPDAELVENPFEIIINEIEKHPSEDILISGSLINDNGTLQTSCWKFPTPLQHLLEFFFLNQFIDTTTYKQSDIIRTFEVDFLSGAFIFFRKDTLKKLKGIDENLFWMDDVDLCKRNTELGGKNIYVPSIKIKHHIGQSSKKNYKIVISNQIISKLKYYKKHQQFFYYYISIPIFLLQIITRIPFFICLSVINSKYRNKASAYLYTFVKFFGYLLFGNKKVI